MENEYNTLTTLIIDEITKIDDEEILMWLLHFVDGLGNKE